MLILDFLPVKYLSSVPRQWHCKKCSVTPFVVPGLGKYLSSFSEPLLRPNCKTLRIPHSDRSKNKAEGASSLFTVQYREVKRTGGRQSGGKMLLSFNTRLVMFMQRSRLSACQLSARLPWARCSPPLKYGRRSQWTPPQWPAAGWMWPRACSFISACHCQHLCHSLTVYQPGSLCHSELRLRGTAECWL